MFRGWEQSYSKPDVAGDIPTFAISIDMAQYVSMYTSVDGCLQLQLQRCCPEPASDLAFEHTAPCTKDARIPMHANGTHERHVSLGLLVDFFCFVAGRHEC